MAVSSANLSDHNCCAICENVLELYINPIEILENWDLVTAQLLANKCTCKDVSAYDCDYEKYQKEEIKEKKDTLVELIWGT